MTGVSLSNVIAETLIREFLKSHNYASSIESLAKESILNKHHNVPKITSRAELSKLLGVTKLVKLNKESDTPLKSILEIIIQNLIEKNKAKSADPSSSSSKQRKPKSDSISSNSADPFPHTHQNPYSRPEATVVSRMEFLSINAQNNNYLEPVTKTSVDEFTSISTISTRKLEGQQPVATSRDVVTLVEDFNDSDEDRHTNDSPTAPLVENSSSSSVDTSDTKIDLSLKSRQISLHEALELRRIVFGNVAAAATTGSTARLLSFTEEWKGKGFVFNDLNVLRYGLVQLKGGPCGLLAAIQAHILKHLIYPTNGKSCMREGLLRPTQAECKSALIESISDIIWRAGGQKIQCILAIFSPKQAHQASTSIAGYIPDGLTEKMVLHSFTSRDKLKNAIIQNIETFTANEREKHGIIQLLYSAILSRGIEEILVQDFDDSFGGKGASNTFIGRHGYCTQEMLSLFLFGRAIANVFDGNMFLDEDGKGILRGVPAQCDFGYLTLFEHYQSVKVGEYLKNPKLPIFVVCSESHFTILFSSTNAPLEEKVKKFDLIYYDGLANQDEEIILTVSPYLNHTSTLPRPDNDLTPPLELCIRTKWSRAFVDWNSTDPLL